MNRVRAVLLLFVFLVGSAYAQPVEVTWWDFLVGGDGVRMKAMIDEFNTTHPDIEIVPTTLEWGVPFYTKVQTSTAVGQQPDVMTYHLSRFPLAVSSGALRPFSEEELASVGLSTEDYFPNVIDKATLDGQLYGVPFDISTIVLYYNKDVLGELGMLDENGLPGGLDGIDNFNAALARIADETDRLPLSFNNTTSGTTWRIFYTLLQQQNAALIENNEIVAGEEVTRALEIMRGWVESGYAEANIEYEASIALFTSGRAALHINGVWEVPTMVDLTESGELPFEWGAVALPVFFDRAAYWADTHTLAVPNSEQNPISDEKLAAVLEVIAWMNKNSMMWASAGHIPAYRPVVESSEYQSLEPNATYAVAGESVVYDPDSPIAGVASPLYDAILNYFVPAINGQLPVEQAVQMLEQDLSSQLR